MVYIGAETCSYSKQHRSLVFLNKICVWLTCHIRTLRVEIKISGVRSYMVKCMGPWRNRNYIWSTPTNLQPHIEDIHALFYALSGLWQCCQWQSSWNVMAHGDAREEKRRGKLSNAVGSQYPSHYLGTRCIQHYYHWCRTPRLPAVDWTDAPPTGRFKWTRSVSRERRDLVSAHVPSHFKRSLPTGADFWNW